MAPATGAVWAIVVAAGSGIRFGGPKQFVRLAGERVVDRSVVVARASCDGVVLVLADPEGWDGPGVDAVVAGGATRAESVRAGLAAVPGDAAVVVVHDAARPLATAALYAAVVDAVRAGADGALPGLPVADTIKRVEHGIVSMTVSRDGLVAAQTPQAFRAEVLRAAHSADPDATDDAALVEATGGKVVIVPGDPRNVKLTAPRDLAVAQALLDAGGA